MTGGGGAILRCSVPPAARCPTYEDAEITLLWSATLTVGERLSGTTVLGAGFNRGNSETEIGAISDDSFDLTGAPHVVTQIQIAFPTLSNGLQLILDTPIGEEADRLTLHLDSVSLPLRNARVSEGLRFFWTNHGLTWSDEESVAVRLIEYPPPNAYGYRTIWTALMTVEQHPSQTTYFGRHGDDYGKITNDTIVDGRTDRGVIDDQFRYPWSGYKIVALVELGTFLQVEFDSASYPSADELAGWTLVLGGKELPFADATPVHASTPYRLKFTSYDPNWADGDQVAVSIRTKDVQNRFGQVDLKAGRSTTTDGNNNIIYGKTHYTYARGDSKFGPRGSWDLQNLRVTTDKTGDTDPVWITATFRAPNESVAWTGYWVGQFDDFHTLFLRWVYHVDGVGRGEATYTLPLRTAATEGGIRRSRSGRDISFTWVRTYKEFQRRHLDLANHSDIFADFLAPPKPATARAGGQGFSLSEYYDPAPTVTSVGFTSNPGSDRVYGPGDTIQVTVTFDQDVTVGYVNSKRDAAKLDLEIGGQTRTAHYARTDGNKVIFEYTVRPGDETPSFLFLRPNSLRLYRDTPSEDGSIRNSSGRDAVLDHYGLADNGHLVDTVGPEFANAQVSSDGAQVAVTFNEGIRSPAILRAFGVQTSLLQSLALDVRVDGEIAVRSNAAVSGDTVTLTVSEPITQGQTVTVSYDNLFIETGESIFEDLRGNSLLTFAEQPASNGSTVADADRPGGGLALSRTDLIIKEGDTGAYTVALTSQPAADVTVAIGDHPAGRATVSPTSLTFTADNWNTPQTVTISSTEDSNYLDRWVMLRHTATGDNYRATAAAWLILRDNYNLTTATANTPAAGSPTIGGTPEVGQTLTLDIASIADAEGLTNAYYTYMYQWLRNGAEIPEATDTSYTLVSADEGKTIKVKVSFTDDANNAESRTSAATVAVAPRPNSSPTGAPTINGTPQVEQTLTADTSAISDGDGLSNVSYQYQWLRDGADIAGQTNSTYRLVSADQDKTIKVRVTFRDDADNAESLTSEATVAVAAKPNSEPTGLPTISGTAQVGQKLTADTSGITDADGLTNVSYSYQWIRNDGTNDSDIGGQTGSTYTLTDEDVGKSIKVKVSFTDDADNEETLTSSATAAVAAAPSRLTVSLENAATTHDGSAVFTFEIRFSEEFALSYTTLKFHAFDVTGGEVLNAQRMDKPSNIRWLITVGPDVNGDVTVVLPVTEDCAAQGAICTEDGRPLSNRLDMTVTGPLSADQNTEATGLPTISGTVQVDQTLTADTSGINDADGLTNLSYSYQWIRNDGTNDSDIGGQTGSTYTLVSADEGKAIKVRVNFTDDAGNEETLTSSATAAVAVRPNTPATGLPTISGTAQVDETLTANISGMADEDGLTNVSYSYQWIRNDGTNDGDIGGQTGSTYTLVSADEGKTIKVRVSFTDDAGNEETLTSSATAAVAAAPSRLTVSLENAATTHDGSAVFTFEIRFSEEFALSYTTLKFHAFDVTGGEVLNAQRMDKPSNIRWLITVGPDVNGDVTVVLPVTEDCAAQGAICTEDGRPLSNRLDMTVTGPLSADQNTEATGLPTISGTVQVGETLTADVSSIADADGLTNVSYSYQWIRNDGGTDADIAGETASTHTLVSADEGKTIKVRVSFTDDAGNEETLTSAATAAVASRPNTPATGLPTISGTVQVDQTLTADTSGINDADGLTNLSYSYQWIRNDGTNDSDIGGQTGSTYTLVSADEGKAIKVRVSFTDDAGNEETLTSSATAAVAVRPNTPATGLPTISGTAQVDETLTANISGMADEDGLTNVSYSYQWIRNDGTNDADIGGQTGSTYTLVSADEGKTIKVRVSFTDDAGNEETLTSAATAAVAARPNTPATGLPTISGTAQAGKTLTANISGMADEDGLDNAEFSYQWLANDADIQNATDSTYTLTDDDVGKTIKVRVSFTDDRSNDETLTSAATDTVVAKPDSPDTDAPPRDPGATVDVTVGNTVTGEIEEAIEVDWFKVSLLASETYQIDMRGAWGGEWARIDGEIVWVAPGTLHDPKLLGVFSAANVLVPGTDEEVSGDDRGDYEEGKNSRITSFSPPADGYYYIAAAAEAAWTGTYELTVTVVADE